jgi:cation transport regulator ChaB
MRSNPAESREQVAHKVAWAAVKHKYHKEPGGGKSGHWEKGGSSDSD